MADIEESQFSLMSLEDELTCSICLSPFDCPVTIPCGHNFCQDCLLNTWTDTYSCPQCRTLFATKPELKKNTVLSSVVQTFTLRSSKSEASLVEESEEEEEEEEEDAVVRCDTCMEADASQTCFTCIASFCEEHLRPHRENPTFSLHQLSEPVNLLERICEDHHKLMEFFCSQHDRPICSFCLQQVHKGCTFMSLEEQRSLKEVEKDDVVRCDTCMEADASQTCFTCMASYCEEHLRPHRENPTFRLHQLSEPVNLSEHVCPDHHKLMEFFCSQHDRPICSFCLQQVHKGCTFMSPEEQRSLKETDLRDKLGLLDGKIEKTETVMFQINDMQSKLKEAATKRKTAFAAVFQQMRDMLAQEEREAQHEVDHELETGQMKLRDLMKKLTENTENMTKAREDINSLLSQSQTLAFLQASFDLPRATKFEPHTPRINLDSKKVTARQAFAGSLKEHLTEIFIQPVEARLVTLKPDESAAPVSGSTGSQLEYEQPDPPEQRGQTTFSGFVCPPIQPLFQPVPVPFYIRQHGGFGTSHHGQGQGPGSHRGPPFRPGQRTDKRSDTGHHSSHHKRSDTGHHSSHRVGDKKSDTGHHSSHDKRSDTGHDFSHHKRSDSGHHSSHRMGDKKSDTGHHSSHRQDQKPQSASGGKKPSGKGSDSAKKDNPRSHHSSGKPTGPHPRPHKNK